MKKELLLFLTSNYSTERINYNLLDDNNNKYGFFDEVKRLNENDLDDYIKPIVKHIIDNYSRNDGWKGRGYGYWIWKPYLILKELKSLNEGDILAYLDIHTHFDKIKYQYDEILNVLENDEHHMIISKGYFNDFMFTTTYLKNIIEEELNYKFTEDQLLEVQRDAGIIFIKKCDFTIKFFEQYFNIMLNHIDAITDDHNQDIDNHSTFVENRHDQSVCSLLAKYYNINACVDNVNLL